MRALARRGAWALASRRLHTDPPQKRMVRVSPEHRLACHVYAAAATRSPPSPSLLPPPPPPLLLLRGFGMTKEDSHQLAAALAARGQRVVTFDYRALGESEAPSRRLDGWRLPDLARDCAGLMRGLGFAAEEGAGVGGSGYSVLGASMGGYIAAVSVFHKLMSR